MSTIWDQGGSAHDIVWAEEQGASPAGARETGSAARRGTEFTISELAKEFGVTLRTLRFYEDKGLISPRRHGMTRLYSEADRERLALIIKGKKLGFMLGEIRQMVAAGEGRDSQDLKLSREKCLEQIELLKRQQTDIEEALAELRGIYAALSAKLAQSDSSSH